MTTAWRPGDQRPSARGTRRSRQQDDGEGRAPGGNRRLGDALGAYVRSQGHMEAALLGAVWSHWESVVGGDVAAHAEPRGLRGDELVVAVDHPSWATQLAFFGAGILEQLEERMGQHVASRLKVTVRGRSDLG
ncbi:MAG: DUF721 domain-containing protein [Acidimicrobiales bacterium]